MSEQGDVSYSHEETVAAFAGFYELLRKMYLPDGLVIYPPPGGWPSIVNADPTLLETFGKSQEVVALLAHLPYIRSYNGDWGEDPDVLPYCHFADWRHHFDSLSKRIADADDHYEPPPLEALDDLRRTAEGDLYDLNLPHIVGIALNSSEDRHVIILDTKRGVILWDESTCPRGVRDQYSAQSLDFGHYTQDGLAWTIPTFFEILKTQFLELRWVPSSQFAVRSEEWSEGLPGEKGMTAMCQGIFRKHGWPNLERYSKSDCMAEVKEAMEEHFDDHLDHRS